MFYLFTTYFAASKVVPISVFMFSCFFINLRFFIFTSQKSSQYVGKYLCRTLSIILKKLSFIIFLFYQIIVWHCHPNIIISTFGKKNTYSIIANGIGRVHKIGKHNRKKPGMTTNPLTVPIQISKFHNTKDKKIDMTLN